MDRLVAILTVLIPFAVGGIMARGKRESLPFWILLAAVAGSVFNCKLFSISPFKSTELVIVLAAALLAAQRYGKQRSHRHTSVQKLLMTLMALLALAALVALIPTDLRSAAWVATIVPLAVVYITFNSVKNPVHIQQSLVAIGLSLLGFLVLIQVAISTGLASSYYNSAEMAAGAYGYELEIGPFSYSLWGNWIGAAGAIAATFAAGCIVTRQRHWWWLYSPLLVIGLWTAHRSSTLGGSAGAIVGMGLAFLCGLKPGVGSSSRHLIKVMILAVAIGFGCVLLASNATDNMLSRWESVLLLKDETKNVAYRTNLYKDAFETLATTPLGIGFGTLWEVASVDEANYYTSMMNGTGIIGTMALASISCVLGITFYRRLLTKYPDSFPGQCSAIGISILGAIAVVANSSDQILLIMPTGPTLWFLLAVLVSVTNVSINTRQSPQDGGQKGRMWRGRMESKYWG